MKLKNIHMIGSVFVIIIVILSLVCLQVIHEYPAFATLPNTLVILSNYEANEAKIEEDGTKRENFEIVNPGVEGNKVENTKAENTEGDSTKEENPEGDNTKAENTEGDSTKAENTEGDNTKAENIEGDNVKEDTIKAGIQKESITTNLSAVDKEIFKRCLIKSETGFTERRTCSPNMMFRPPNDSNPVTALISFPGSGNTWVRQIIEETTGIYTGSIYCDRNLKSKGFYGENLTSNSMIAIKTHIPGNRRIDGKEGKEFESVVLLIRNPFYAILAEANRDWGDGHTAVAKMKDLTNLRKWAPYVAGMSKKWEKTIIIWMKDDKPLLVVRYEDLQSDLINETKRLLKFFKVPYTDEKVNCVLNSDFNTFKRNHDTEEIDIFEKYYYNESVRKSVNISIQNVRTLLQKYTTPY